VSEGGMFGEEGSSADGEGVIEQNKGRKLGSGGE
jgi:hypothetical protein